MTRTDVTLLAMAVLFVGMLLYVPANAQGTYAQVTSAMGVKAGCDGVVATDNKKTDFMGGFCAGVVTALVSAGKNNSLNPICSPENATTGQAVLIVLKYMSDNPRVLNEPFANVAGWALSQTWPCSKK